MSSNREPLDGGIMATIGVWVLGGGDYCPFCNSSPTITYSVVRDDGRSFHICRHCAIRAAKEISEFHGLGEP